MDSTPCCCATTECIHARTICCLARATTKLPAQVARAQEPTKISTAPYPNFPNRPPMDEDPPAWKSSPETMGPITAERPLAKDTPENAMLVNSGTPPADSTAAIVHVDEKPPLCAALSIHTFKARGRLDVPSCQTRMRRNTGRSRRLQSPIGRTRRARCLTR